MGKKVGTRQFTPQKEAANTCYYCERPFSSHLGEGAGIKTIDPFLKSV